MKADAPATVIFMCALPIGLEELSKQWRQTEWCHLSPRYKGQMTPNTAATSAMASDMWSGAPTAAKQSESGGRRYQKVALEQNKSY